MKLLLAKNSFYTLLLGEPKAKKEIQRALEALTKKNALFCVSLASVHAILSAERDSSRREILWTQSKNFFAEILPVKKEEISLALKLSASTDLNWEEWLDVASASLSDLDGILSLDSRYRKQTLMKVLLAEEIDLDGIA